jgi:hypothetical protein
VELLGFTLEQLKELAEALVFLDLVSTEVNFKGSSYVFTQYGYFGELRWSIVIMLFQKIQEHYSEGCWCVCVCVFGQQDGETIGII